MKTYNFSCHSCGSKTEHKSEKNFIPATMEISWGVVFDVSNGMKTVYFCPECFSQAKALANQLKEIIKLDHFHFESLVKKD